MDYGDNVLNAHEVSELAAKVQKYPALPASHNTYFHHSTPKPAPVAHHAPHHHSTPAPPPHPPVTLQPALPPHPPAPHYHDDPIPILDDNYLEYEDPINYEVSFQPINFV